MTGTGLSLGNHTSFFFDRNLKTSPLKTRKAAKGKTSSKARLCKVLIPLPPLRVQEKLILAMDREEAQIRSCEQKIEQSNLREETLINELTRMNNEEKASEA